MLTKKWYKSKVLWVNVVAICIFSVQQLTGIVPVLTSEMSATCLAVLNILLRIITTEGLEG